MTLLLLFSSGTGIQPAVETNSAQALVYVPQIQPASETDTAGVVTPIFPVIVAVSATSESNSAQAITPSKRVSVSVAYEDHAAHDLYMGMSGSGATVIVLFATAYGNVNTPVAPPPTGITATVYKRVSVTVPAPTLDSEGFPV